MAGRKRASARAAEELLGRTPSASEDDLLGLALRGGAGGGGGGGGGGSKKLRGAPASMEELRDSARRQLDAVVKARGRARGGGCAARVQGRERCAALRCTELCFRVFASSLR
jgi:hypothetical protein